MTVTTTMYPTWLNVPDAPYYVVMPVEAISRSFVEHIEFPIDVRAIMENERARHNSYMLLNVYPCQNQLEAYSLYDYFWLLGYAPQIHHLKDSIPAWDGICYGRIWNLHGRDVNDAPYAPPNRLPRRRSAKQVAMIAAIRRAVSQWLKANSPHSLINMADYGANKQDYLAIIGATRACQHRLRLVNRRLLRAPFLADAWKNSQLYGNGRLTWDSDGKNFTYIPDQDYHSEISEALFAQLGRYLWSILYLKEYSNV